jgi:cell division control protein 6
MILKDGDKLLPSYVPAEIPHREEQVNDLVKYFSSALESPETAGLKFYQAVGPVGSGKTVTTLKWGEAMEQAARKRGVDLKHIYVNPRQHGNTRLMLFRYIVQSVEPSIFSTSYGAEELILELLRYLNRKGRYLIMTFDELDYFVNQSKEQVVYNLTRLNEALPGTKCGLLGIVFTARSQSYQNRLDEAELSSLGRYYVRFESYNSSQILDILERRCYEAVNPGAVDTNVLRYISEITASPPADGDVRYALSVLYNACVLAENQGSAKLELEQVRTVLGVLSPSITEEELLYLPDDERLILLSIAKGLRHNNQPYLSFDQIAAQMDQLREKGRPKLDLRELVRGVQDLQNRGIVEVKGLTEIGISHVPANALERLLDHLIGKLGGERR